MASSQLIARRARETSGRLAPAAHFAKFDSRCIDRLARSIGDLQDIVRAVRAKGASLRATEQPIDTNTAAGKCFLDMLGVFAEFETNLRRERQLEGIAKAKAAGIYKGRPVSIDVTKVRQLKAKGMGASEIAKALKIGRASVYRVLGERG
jgi:DNA invertase Pin-like site-specific DNA recombinase